MLPLLPARTCRWSPPPAFRAQAAETEKSRVKLARQLASSTGRSTAEMEALIEHDQYYSAEEACAIGLIDAISGRDHFHAALRTRTEAPAATQEPSAEAEEKSNDAGQDE
eukprot:6213300-Pleurochrysis_carterae.AAC.2